MNPIKTLYAALALTLGASLAAPSQAQPSGAQGEHFVYRVRAGDTLLELSATYTRQARNWPVLQRLNQVDEPTRLPIGKELRIPFSLIPEVDAPLRITHRAGLVRINGQALPEGRTQLSEGDRIETGPDGYLTLTLQDESRLSVPAGARLTVTRTRAFEGTGLIDSIVGLEEGDVESRVSPEQRGVGRFEIRTPVSVTGVRGTELRVRAEHDQAFSEIIEGRAEFTTSARAHPTPLPHGQGAVIDRAGELRALAPLPPAPQLSEPVREGGRWRSDITPVPGASAYLVQTALDPQGANLLSRRISPETRIHFSGRRPGPHYVLVRAIGQHGLMGPDAVQSFEGALALSSSDGQMVLNGFGEPVLLTQY